MFYHRLNCFRIICNYLNCQMLLVCAALPQPSSIRTYTIKHSNLAKRKSCAVRNSHNIEMIEVPLLRVGTLRINMRCAWVWHSHAHRTTHKLTSIICDVWKPIVSTIHHVCTHVHVCTKRSAACAHINKHLEITWATTVAGDNDDPNRYYFQGNEVPNEWSEKLHC